MTKSEHIKCLAITLDPNGERYKTFLKNNEHLQPEYFRGVIGKDLRISEIIRQSLATKELCHSTFFKYGMMGNAASHRAIWRDVEVQKTPYLVLEDDCYTHPKITNFINKHIDSLKTMDICLFGINLDSVLCDVSPTGLKSARLFSPKQPYHNWIMDAFEQTKITNVEFHRLAKAFGTPAYFITPKGAKKLLKQIFPLSLDTSNIPLINPKMPSSSIDRSACRIYSTIEAYICQPFLAFTPNSNSSTKT